MQILRLLPNGLLSSIFAIFSATRAHQWSHGIPVVATHYRDVIDLLGPSQLNPLEQSHKDIVVRLRRCTKKRSFIYFGLFIGLLVINSALQAVVVQTRLLMARSLGIHRLSRFTFRRQLAAGGALGAALDVWHSLGQPRSKPMYSAYRYVSTTFRIDSLLSNKCVNKLQVSGCSVARLGDVGLSCESIFRSVNHSISEGLVVGWFEGRMEWGPRALGHRSILCDPRRADMKDILNLKIKRRESFRPFAPSVLQEVAPEWFEFVSPLDAEVPFMMQVYPIRDDKRHLIPAVTHVDGTGRLQTVNEDHNGRYFRLISRFYAHTGVPICLTPLL